jgi:hypothetical protein
MGSVFASWRLPLQALAIAGVIVGIRLIVERTGIETISVSPLVATIITANVFIIGFLLTGVISDYKESEKVPGDLAVSLGTIADECALIWRSKDAAPARDALREVFELVRDVKRWFYKEARTHDLLERVSGLGNHFARIEPFTQPNFIVRLKQEQTSISRMLTRVHTIRETSFVSSGYVMAKLATALVLIGLLLLEVHPWYESVFLVGVIAWFLSYVILLIADLDNPFDYTRDGKARGQEVSLKPLDDVEVRIAHELGFPDYRPSTATELAASDRPEPAAGSASLR